MKFTILLFCGLSMVCTACAQKRPAFHYNSAEFNQKISELINLEMEKHRIPGVAFIVIKDDKVLLSKGFGLANMETNQAVNPETSIFRIGSISKLVTSMALMKLVDQGLLDLNAPVNSYFETPLFQENHAEPVRVNHLLNHSSGFDQTGYARRVATATERPSLDKFLRDNLVALREPGKVGVYDTYGITLSGRLIERITGKSYVEYMNKEFFPSIGMNHSYVEVSGADKKNLAVGYGLSDGKLIPQPYEYYVTLPASSIDSTPNDMGKFVMALINNGKNNNGRMFSDKMGKQIKTPQFDFGDGVHSFAYGFWENSARGYRTIDHGGIVFGYESKLFLIPDFNIGFFIVQNRDPETGPPTNLTSTVTRFFVDHLFGDPLPVSNKRTEIETSKFEGIYIANLGCFSCPSGSGWPISTSRVTSTGLGEIEFLGKRWTAVDSSVFQINNGISRVGFTINETGQVEYLIHQNYSYTNANSQLLDKLVKDRKNKQLTRLQKILEENGFKVN